MKNNKRLSNIDIQSSTHGEKRVSVYLTTYVVSGVFFFFLIHESISCFISIYRLVLLFSGCVTFSSISCTFHGKTWEGGKPCVNTGKHHPLDTSCLMLKAEDMPRNNDKTNWHKQKGTIRQGGILWIDASKHTHTHQRGGGGRTLGEIHFPTPCVWRRSKNSICFSKVSNASSSRAACVCVI
jgi:hypothetical protein